MDEGKEVYELACVLYKKCDLLWHDCVYLANNAVKQGYRKQVEAEWTPVEKLILDWGANIIHHYECSNCKTLEYTNDRKYCPNCGAKMRKENN